MVFGKENRGSFSLVDSRENKLYYLTQQVMEYGTAEDYEELKAELDHRQFADNLFDTLFNDITPRSGDIQDYDCLRELVGSVEELCGEWSEYSLKYVAKLADVCESKTSEEIRALMVKVSTYCRAF